MVEARAQAPIAKERSPQHRGGFPRLLGCRPRLGGSFANVTPCVAAWCRAQLGLRSNIWGFPFTTIVTIVYPKTPF